MKLEASYSSARDVAAEFETRGLPGNFCHVPFAALILEPDGRVGSCRMKGTDFTVGNLNENTLEEIWNGPILRQWRREFLTGDVKMCKSEVRYKGCNTCPEYNSLLPSIDPVEIQSKQPARIALNLNGKCNLECRMCHIWREPNGLYDERGWWDQVAEWVKSVKEIELLSGEPFIQKDTYRLIDGISQSNPDCEWTITTNANWKFNDHIRATLDKIKFKHLTVSIDSLDFETYPKLRKNGNLALLLETVDRLIEYDQTRIERGLGSLNIHVCFLVQKDNWSELARFHEYAKEKGVRHFLIFLFEPIEHSLLSLSQNEREEILRFCTRTLSREHLNLSRKVFLPLLDSLPAIAKAEHLLEFQRRLAVSEPVEARA
ncbi:MAG: radical SAM protein [Bdellovibrionota bacterium]